MKASKRVKLAWRAFSVQALTLLATQEVWYPLVKTTAEAAFGPDAEAYLQTAIAVAGVVGWVAPQPSISGDKTKLNNQ